MANKGIIDPRGQWAHPGKVTTIPSNNITMQGVNYPVLGVSNTGDTKLMMPGQNYKFKGKYVTEYPWLKKYQAGGTVDPTKVVYDKQKELLSGLGLPMPTAADSLAVYNNTLALEKFYKDPKRGYKIKPSKGSLTPYLDLNQTVQQNKDNLDYFSNFAKNTVDWSMETLERNKKNEQDAVNTFKGSSFNYEKEILEKQYGVKMKDFDTALTKNKLFSPYQYQVQDNVPGAINPAAPANYTDFRIAPSNHTVYESDRDMGALTVINSYDPLDIKPYSMRTEKEKEYHRKRMQMLATNIKGGSTGSTTAITPKPKPTKFGQTDPQTTKPITPIKREWFRSAPDIKPMQNKLPAASKPSFAIPSTVVPTSGASPMKDIYEWDDTNKQYKHVDTVTPAEAQVIYKAYNKNSLESMKQDLNSMNLNPASRNPFTEKKAKGGWLNNYQQ